MLARILLGRSDDLNLGKAHPPSQVLKTVNFESFFTQRMKNQQTKNLHRLLWLANVQQFFPDKEPTTLWNDYKSWLDSRTYFQDLYQRYPLKVLKEIAPLPLDMHPDGGILMTFHYGPYRLLPKIWVSLGYKLTLLAAAHILDREAEHYSRQLQEAGLPDDMLQCIDANSPCSLRKILSAVKEKRLVLVFLDANEGQQKEAGDQDKLQVPYAAHYIAWRTNLLKFAVRFKIPIYSSYLQPCQAQMPWAIGPVEQILSADECDAADGMMRAFSRLQITFQHMMKKGWVYWENWAFIHQYMRQECDETQGIAASGSWLLPLSYQQEKYLFDIRNRQFFQIKS